MCLGLSPVAAWIALRGDVSWAVVMLGAAVTLWVAGFDIIYACQDLDFDHTMDLHSIPKKFGIAAALYASAALHVLMLALLIVVAQMSGLGWIALAGLAAVAALLAYEHLLVKPSDLSRVNAAFFTINGYISVLFFLTWAAAILVR
jgi:4-hydroxybenzoate polyprenyltransferase